MKTDKEGSIGRILTYGGCHVTASYFEDVGEVGGNDHGEVTEEICRTSRFDGY